VINCFFLQITVAHGLLFSLVQFPWMYLWSLPLRLLFGLPPVASYLFTYTPILVILIRRKHDRHNIIGRFFIRAIWDPPLMACIYLVAHTGLDGGRFMTPFLTYIDDAIGKPVTNQVTPSPSPTKSACCLLGSKVGCLF
jgi:hypothetical protein